MLGIGCPDRHALPRIISSKLRQPRRVLFPARAGSFFGASCPFPWGLAKVSSLKAKRAFSLGDGNRPRCPRAAVCSASRKARPQTQHQRSGLSCRFWDLSCRRLLQSDTLMNKQPALPADPAAISGETSIRTDDAVARNHNGNRVCAIGQANSTDRFRAPQLPRQRPITQRGSRSDRSKCRPNLALKGRASGRHGNGVDREEIA
jgi:hypothetical protein